MRQQRRMRLVRNQHQNLRCLHRVAANLEANPKYDPLFTVFCQTQIGAAPPRGRKTAIFRARLFAIFHMESSDEELVSGSLDSDDEAFSDDDETGGFRAVWVPLCAAALPFSLAFDICGGLEKENLKCARSSRGANTVRLLLSRFHSSVLMRRQLYPNTSNLPLASNAAPNRRNLLPGGTPICVWPSLEPAVERSGYKLYNKFPSGSQFAAAVETTL
ncbi:hypothetical protein ON010_g11956 [Phytophthora cinnamomi]|nr:hypothetical protein ON010_g11956 [Phytophthora cinnamomi]